MRGAGEGLAKPMVMLGTRPILWHLMKYYSYWGHRDFILCLGYRGELIKEFFTNYKEWVSNDFVLSNGGRSVELLNRDAEDWRITFVDTGAGSSVGERLLAVRDFLRDEDVFLANYADGLSDFPLPLMLDKVARSGAVGAFLTVQPNTSFHFVMSDPDGTVTGVQAVEQTDLYINGGFFAFRRQIFDYMRPGEELVEEPFARLIEERLLTTLPYRGFWRACDTFKDLQTLEALLNRGPAPWELWRRPPPPQAAPAAVAAVAVAVAAANEAGPLPILAAG
jgi:glucose-1-phosphate cytidylyltransferase